MTVIDRREGRYSAQPQIGKYDAEIVAECLVLFVGLGTILAVRPLIPVEGCADVDAWLSQEAPLRVAEQAEVGADDELRLAEAGDAKVVHSLKNVDAEQRLTALELDLDTIRRELFHERQGGRQDVAGPVEAVRVQLRSRDLAV